MRLRFYVFPIITVFITVCIIPVNINSTSYCFRTYSFNDIEAEIIDIFIVKYDASNDIDYYIKIKMKNDYEFNETKFFEEQEITCVLSDEFKFNNYSIGDIRKFNLTTYSTIYSYDEYTKGKELYIDEINEIPEKGSNNYEIVLYVKYISLVMMVLTFLLIIILIPLSFDKSKNI